MLTVCAELAQTRQPEALTHPHTSIVCLADNEDARRQACEDLQEEFEILLWSEQLANHNADMRGIVDAIPWRHSASIRLYMHVNELELRQHVVPQPSVLSQRLCPTHYRLPDEKGTEDVHQYCRDETRRSRNVQVTASRLFAAAQESDVPRKRGIRSVHVSAEAASQARRSRTTSMRRLVSGAPKHWDTSLDGILHPHTDFVSTGAAGYMRGCSAWLWLKAYKNKTSQRIP